jgi:flagellar motor switch protein FliM
MFMGEKFGRDSIWENHLATELWFTDVELEAVLDTTTAKLSDVLNWTVGSRLDLFATPNSLVELQCGEVLLFRGQMGRKGEKIAIRVDQKLET